MSHTLVLDGRVLPIAQGDTGPAPGLKSRKQAKAAVQARAIRASRDKEVSAVIEARQPELCPLRRVSVTSTEAASLDVDVRTDVPSRVRIDPAVAGIPTGIDSPVPQVHSPYERALTHVAGVFKDSDGAINTAGIDCEAPRLRAAVAVLPAEPVHRPA